MAVKIGDVTIRIGASTTELEKDLRKAERALQSTALKFTAIGQNLTLGVTLPVLAAGAAAFKMASDYEESLNKVRAAFGSSSSSVEEFSKNAIDSLGLAEQSALDMAALFGDMATSMGLTRPAAAEMSTSLVQLAGDLSSFKNINIEEVTTALAGVFTGETESLKRLGIVMTEANVQAYALEKGIKKKLNTMSQAEKVALRYEYVLNVTKNAQGDFARTSDGAANQLRALQQSVKQLGQQFGSVLLPILTPLISSVREVVNGFANLSKEGKQTITTVAGVAAAIGPLLVVYGQLKSIYGEVAIGAARITAAWITQSATAAAAAGTLPTLTAATVTFTTTVRAALAFIAPYAAAVAAVGVAVFLLYKSYQNRNREIEQGNTLDKIAVKNVEQERQKTVGLIGVLKSEVASKQDKKKAVQELQRISPKYFGDLDSEKININKLNESYEAYLKNLVAVSKAKAARAEIEKLSGSLVLLEKANFDRLQQSAINADKLQQNEIGYTPDQLQKAEISYKNLDEVNQKYYEKQKQTLQNQIDYFAKFAAEEEKINGKRATSTGGKQKDLKYKFEVINLGAFQDDLSNISLEFAKLENAFQLGLIDQSELSTQKIEILTNELQKLSDSGVSPASEEVLKLKRQLQELSSNTYNIKGQLPDTTTNDILVDLNKELAVIQDKTSAGLFGDLQADELKLEAIKSALSKLFDEGLGGTDVAKNLQDQLQKVTKQDQFKQLGSRLEQEFGKIAEQASQVVTPLFAAISQGFANKSAELDNYYNKEKAYIEASGLTEEEKAKRIAALDEKTNLQRKRIARDQAKASKAQAIFEATINGTLATLKALAQTGNPFFAALVGAAAAAQIAAIVAQPLPSLAIGTDMVKRDGMAMIHKGEAIVPASVVKGGFTGGGNQLTGRLSGIDILISARNSERYLNKIG